MQRLILTGDDFGQSEAINRAIRLAHQQGVLTSASLLVNGPAWEEAVAFAREAPSLSVGLHLALVQSKATLPHQEIPGLVDPQGNFSDNPVAAGMRYYFKRSLQGQLEREIQTQIEKFLDTGLPLSYLDGHLNLHVHPRIFPIVRELLPRYGIQGFRLPREPLWINLSLDRTRLPYKLLHWLIFRWLARNCLRVLRDQGIVFPHRVFGLLQSGQMDEAYLAGLLKNLPPGTAEIYFHLSDGQPWLHAPTYRPQAELEALLSPRLAGLIRDQGIQLSHYADLIGDRG
ncbi:MAG: hopanoid biosynthesis-associated protein HpnK [Candidatus Tectomicrobia bacterium]|uniref:Hopanoid biosynthesis-associated protein HpnK n=1 Tax=Tectimicrobiota bacterium TaxID=2528274 RepID=A0A932FYB4_UNCTE|nr:hopanoid biosynthesis-associated protein HpnK [Candidatus Tectomicrobia bacterium]